MKDKPNPSLIVPKLYLLCVLFSIAGCASQPERWLTAEEDADLRAKCEPHGGCVAVPNPVWQQIEMLLRRMGGTAI